MDWREEDGTGNQAQASTPAGNRSGSGELLARAHGLSGDLTALRRTIHQHPELGFEESGTRALVREFLEPRALGARFASIARTGLLVSLRGEGPSVLLRACLDALPIQDTKSVEYRSLEVGKSHACGHDAQVARLVGAVSLLAGGSHRAEVHALFQPAEEIDLGAKATLSDGLLDLVKPDMAFGFHGHPGLAAGTIGVKTGPIMGSITTIRCRVHGKEGHGAEPHLATDSVTAAASLILDWQITLARRIDPREAVVLSIGRLSSGIIPNVIPGSAELEGTLRLLDSTRYQEVIDVLGDVAKATELKFGVTVELEAELVVPAIVNDPDVTDLVLKATNSTLGSNAVTAATPSLGGDDFAWYLKKIPGAYFFIGEGVQGRDGYGWHDPGYDIDETSLVTGSAVLAEIVNQVGGATS